MSRWFRVAADIFEHEFFAHSEMSEREAFLWLLAKAAWKDTRHRVGAEMLPVPRGSLFVTLREICAAWGWKSDFRVRSFLDAMENEGMIKRTANAGKTCVSICNYDRYQTPDNEDKRKENEPETHGKRTENALKIPVYQDTKEEDPSSLRSDGAQRGKPVARKSRLPSDFYPNETGAAAATAAGITGGEFRGQLLRFADHHTAKGSMMVDWQAAWRTWCGNYRSFGMARAGPRHNPGPRTAHDAIANELRKYENAKPDHDHFDGITIDASTS